MIVILPPNIPGVIIIIHMDVISKLIHFHNKCKLVLSFTMATLKPCLFLLHPIEFQGVSLLRRIFYVPPKAFKGGDIPSHVKVEWNMKLFRAEI